MQTVLYILLMLFGALLLPAAQAQQAGAAHDGVETITIRMSNFDFAPERLRLKADVPVRLRFVNESVGGHDFSAPAFFAASNYPPGSAAPPEGAVALAGHQTAEISIVPRKPGVYRVECTHFLHSLFGMHGTVEVGP